MREEGSMCGKLTILNLKASLLSYNPSGNNALDFLWFSIIPIP